MLLWLVVTLSPSVAAAFDFRDAADGFLVTLAPKEDERLCVIMPRGAENPKECPPFDYATVAGKEEMILGSAQLTRGDRLLVLSISRSTEMEMAKVVASPEGTARTFADGAAAAMGTRIDTYRATPHRIADRAGLLLDVTVLIPAATPQLEKLALQKMYLFPGKTAGYSILLATDAGSSAWLADVADRMTKTIVADPAPPTLVDAMRGIGTDDPAERPRDRLASTLGKVAAGVILVVVLVVYLRQRKAGTG